MLLAVMGVALVVFSHTAEEKMAFVRNRLLHVLLVFGRDTPDAEEDIDKFEAPVTWPGFLGRCETNGWTMAEKKDAFGWYLSTVATNDCVAFPDFEKELVRVALAQCRDLNYVEARDHLRGLALSPRGIYRDVAIGLAIKFSQVSDSMSESVENIITNTVSYNEEERGWAAYCYCEKLVGVSNTNHVEVVARDRAIQMFYRLRKTVYSPAVAFDRAFLHCLDGYRMSSNRLDFAGSVLQHPQCDNYMRRYFIPATNQLLSAGQPLQQLNLEGNEQ